MFLFIRTVCFRSQSRSVFAWTLCTLASASSSPLIRVMNKRWWMAKKKIKFQLVACIKESDGKQTGGKLLFFITFGAQKNGERHVENEYLHLQTRRFASSKKWTPEWISSRREKNCRRFSRKALAIYDATKWRNCINTLKRNLFNDARDAWGHLGRVERNFICHPGPAVNLQHAKLARELSTTKEAMFVLAAPEKPFLDLIQTQKVSKL